MIIKKIPAAKLIPAAYHPRIDLQPGNAVYEKLRLSIEEFGCVEPIVWNERTGNIVGGHQRLKILLAQGETEIDCVVVDFDDNREKALNLALNKIGGAWDEEKLRSVLESFSADFDAALSGFDLDAIHEILDAGAMAEDDGFDAQAAYDDIVEPVTRRGDVWTLGRHRLLCGDSTYAPDYDRLMQGEAAQLIITDPPYNVDYGEKVEHNKRLGMHVNGSRAASGIENDSMTDATFNIFLRAAFQNMHDNADDGAAIYAFFSSSQAENFLGAFKASGFLYKQCLIWVKNHFVLSRQDYQWKHEPILYGWKPGAAHYFADDRTQPTVIDDGQRQDFRSMKKAELIDYMDKYFDGLGDAPQSVIYFDKPLCSGDHPTMKPVPLIGRLMKNSSRRDWIVLDPFGGSGSALIAAEQLSRRARLMEIDPKYCDVIVRRWEELTGQKAARETTNAV